jgi:predicted metal-dependent hydrolase
MTEKTSEPLTPEQLASRVAALEHVTDIATRNAVRHREQIARIGAMTRAIASNRTSVEDRVALIAALEQIADTLMLEAELDVEQLRYASEPHACFHELDEDELMREAAQSTQH